MTIVDNSVSGGNVMLGFLLGAVMVAVSLIGLFTLGSYRSHVVSPTVTVSQN